MATVSPLGTGNYTPMGLTSSSGQYGNPGGNARLGPPPRPRKVGMNAPKNFSSGLPIPKLPGVPKVPGLPKPKTVPKNATFQGPKPKAPSWQDADYLTTDSDLKRALADFLARQTTEKSRAALDYSDANREMGEQKTKDLDDIREDFAARGILQSGVYGTRVGDYNTDYNENIATLLRRYNDQQVDFADQMKEFQREQDAAREAAKQAAIARRAEKIASQPAKPATPKKKIPPSVAGNAKPKITGDSLADKKKK
jgi:hypothetical protein